MSKAKVSVTENLARYAADSSLEAQSRQDVQESDARNELLQVLKRNVGRSVMLPLDELTIVENVRKQVDTDSPEFAKLVESIRQYGVRQNLIADLRIEADGAWRLTCVAGQRRLLAARAAGRERALVLITQYPDEAGRIVDGLTENLLRTDLHCLDVAEAYAKLHNCGWTEDQIADAFERKRDTVMKLLRLARYSETAKQIIRANYPVFTTRALVNKFVAKAWASEDDLIEGLSQFAGGGKVKKTRSRKTEAKLQRASLPVAQITGLRFFAQGSVEAGKLIVIWKNKQEHASLLKLIEQGQGSDDGEER